jgi:hypothetical protein
VSEDLARALATEQTGRGRLEPAPEVVRAQ